MNELSTKTLSQIVTEHHQSAGVFEKHGLDFCCKGKRSLQTACEEKRLVLNDILGELKQALESNEISPDFTTMPLIELADYIVQVHHGYVKQNLPLILQYVQKVAAKHGDRYPYMNEVQEIFLQLKEELEQHILEEERIVFPRIKQLELGNLPANGTGYWQAPIDVMEEEHDIAGALLQKIRVLTNGYAVPEQACTTFRLSLSSLQAFEADLHRHVHLENNILFPRAIQKAKS